MLDLLQTKDGTPLVKLFESLGYRWTWDGKRNGERWYEVLDDDGRCIVQVDMNMPVAELQRCCSYWLRDEEAPDDGGPDYVVSGKQGPAMTAFRQKVSRATMRAYTFLPHWAHAIAHLGKRCENRSTPIPKGLIGQRVAIHAGAALPRGWEDALRDASPAPLTIWSQEQHDWASLDQPPFKPICTRAIVATAVLWGCTSGPPWVGRWADDAPLDFSGWQDWRDPKSKWGWCLGDVQRLVEPVPCHPGKQGPWRLPTEIAAKVKAAKWEAA